MSAPSSALGAGGSKATFRRALGAMVLMLAAAALSVWMTPTYRIAAMHPINLESLVPGSFADWRIDPSTQVGVVNPQQAAKLQSLYSQLLTRVYVNTRSGERVMLSIAYGEDQRDGMQLHYPEICYPSQGFEILASRKERLQLANGSVPVKRLATAFARERYEPVTYWTMLGDRAVLGGSDKKLAELHYGLRGQIPDGLLFRVSSITRDTEAGFALQDDFLRTLVSSLSDQGRLRLAGLRD